MRLFIHSVLPVIVLALLAGCSEGRTAIPAPVQPVSAPVLEQPDRATLGTPIVETIEFEGGRMVILAFANGDYQAWLLTDAGVVHGIGYQSGISSYRLIPGGYRTTN